MKLLIVTQVVDRDNPVLGFFHRWIEEFAKHADRVEVICLKEGRHALPENVRVHSLGKERGRPRFGSLVYSLRFVKIVWKLRRDYDTVFVHMNSEYLVLAGWLWRLLGKRMGLWYTHKSVHWRLRLGVFWADEVFSASKKSFRMHTKKLHVVGHAIDAAPFLAEARMPSSGALRILTTGRLSAAKRIMETFAALDILNKESVPFTFTVAGTPATADDERYEQEVRAAVATRPYAAQVAFLGGVPHDAIPGLLAKADVFVNLSTTGSMDKAVLEALAAGVPAVSINEAFRDLLAPAGLFVESEDPNALAETIKKAATMDIQLLAAEVHERFALAGTIERIVAILQHP